MFAAISAAFGSVWAFAAGGSLFTYLKIGFVVVAATLVGVFWFQAHNAWRQVGALKLDKERLEQTVGALNIVLAGKNDAIEELEKTAQSLDKRNAALNSILEEIRHAAATDNGPIAKVLDRALRRIDASNGVRSKPKSAGKNPVRNRRSPAKPARMSKGAVMGGA